MMRDHITPSERLARLNENAWQLKLAMCFIAAACILGLMLR